LIWNGIKPEQLQQEEEMEKKSGNYDYGFHPIATDETHPI
jgi:hypothetical protein